MARGIQLSTEMIQIDFHNLISVEKDPRARVRLIALSHVKDGKSKTAAGAAVGMQRDTISDLIARVNSKGLDGIYDDSRTGRPPLLSEDQADDFKKRFLLAQKNKKGGRLTGYDAQKIIAEMGVDHKLSSVYQVLHRIGLSWISSRSMHPKSDAQVQENFKKTLFKK